MKYPLVSYRDAQIGFGFPQVENNEQSAIRNFEYRIKQEGVLNSFPEDFDLYRIGVFDSEKGVINAETVPVLIISGKSLADRKV